MSRTAASVARRTSPSSFSQKCSRGRPRRNLRSGLRRAARKSSTRCAEEVGSSGSRPASRPSRMAASAHAARERANVVERRRERHRAEYADASEGGFQAHDPAHARRNANRAARVGADRRHAKARGNGRGGAAARSARNPVERPGIMRRAVMRIVACNPVGEFMHVGLAEQNGAGAGKLPRDGCVRRGDEIAQDLRSRRRADAARPEVVLQCDRNAEERTMSCCPDRRLRANSFSARRAAASACSAVTVRNALRRGLCRSMRRRNMLRQFDGRNFSFRQQRGKFFDRGKREEILRASSAECLFKSTARKSFPAAADFRRCRYSQ